MDDPGLYRRGVGVMLINADKLVWVGARIDNPEDAWQMPQGGIDGDEKPWPAALRELEEETGIAPRFVERVAKHPELLRYDLPGEWREKLWRGKWKGQMQVWFLARFLGTGADINLNTEHPEFRAWKWVEPSELPELIVPFKRPLYRRLLEDFAQHL